MTPELRRRIARNAPYEELHAAAFPNGGAGSLLADARAKIKAGLITVEAASQIPYFAAAS